MSYFVGRELQLQRLSALLTSVRHTKGPRPGKALLVRGRRRVGKSRLIEEFIDQAGVPAVYFTASTRPTEEELHLFAVEAAGSNLPGADLFRDVSPRSWDAALRLLASALPPDGPSIVVIDELPYLTKSDPGFEGTLQKLFDRELSRRQVLMIGVGSDLAMMEALNDYGRPFHQRATEMVVPSLTPLEVGSMLDLAPADAFDAALVTGGLPMICAEWPRGHTLRRYLEAAVGSPTSALLVSGERSLAAEFPVEAQARVVLSAIGSGERTFANIARAAGHLQQTSLARSLKILIDKRVVVAERPLSTSPSKETRYRVVDPFLRFWLTFLGPHVSEIERGRGDRVVARIDGGWTSWRGRAIEPLLRESVDRLPANDRPAPDGVTGAYWTRSNDIELDVVMADLAPVAKRISAIGSIKWKERSPFDERDFATLASGRDKVPGATAATPVFAIARTGCAVEGLRCYGPDELLAAWNVPVA